MKIRYFEEKPIYEDLTLLLMSLSFLSLLCLSSSWLSESWFRRVRKGGRVDQWKAWKLSMWYQGQWEAYKKLHGEGTHTQSPKWRTSRLLDWPGPEGQFSENLNNKKTLPNKRFFSFEFLGIQPERGDNRNTRDKVQTCQCLQYCYYCNDSVVR